MCIVYISVVCKNTMEDKDVEDVVSSPRYCAFMWFLCNFLSYYSKITFWFTRQKMWDLFFVSVSADLNLNPSTASLSHICMLSF